MSAQNSSGIQTLLEAEKNAHEIVQKARTFRTQRLKAAKTDAAAEIEAYKKEKEEEFKKFEAEHSGNAANEEAAAFKSVESELESVKKAAKAAKATVVKKLVDAVAKPSPELHVNA